jgi:hypothetical protein
MRKPIDRIKALIAAVEIQGIRLVEISASTRIRSAEEVGPVTLSAKTSTVVRDRQKDGTFFILTIIEAQLTPKDEEENSVFTVRAGFELRYQLPSDFAASVSELATFARLNGVYNAWPYWRELIQNTLARMNLPPVTLPLLRMGQRIVQADEDKPPVRKVQ